MSNDIETVGREAETLDNGVLPEMSNCPKGEGTGPESDNWTTLDKGACPVDSVDTQRKKGNWTTGHQKENEKISDDDLADLLKKGPPAEEADEAEVFDLGQAGVRL